MPTDGWVPGVCPRCGGPLKPIHSQGKWVAICDHFMCGAHDEDNHGWFATDTFRVEGGVVYVPDGAGEGREG